MIDLNDKTAIITGGASGIGADMAALFEKYGISMSRWDVNFPENESAKGNIHCDVTNPDSVQKALDETIKQKGKPHYLVNCAGIIYGEKLVSDKGPASLTSFEKLISVNLTGCFNVMRLVAGQMIKNTPYSEDGERGVIINMASIAAFEGQIGQIPYAASKGGIVAMTLPAARELAQSGIRVNAIAPGVVDTPMMSQVPEKLRENLSSSTPFPKRFAKPDEIAELAIDIIRNPMMNGEVIRLDGAMRMPPK